MGSVPVTPRVWARGDFSRALSRLVQGCISSTKHRALTYKTPHSFFFKEKKGKDRGKGGGGKEGKEKRPAVCGDLKATEKHTRPVISKQAFLQDMLNRMKSQYSARLRKKQELHVILPNT